MKTPSDGDGANERMMGVEPATKPPDSAGKPHVSSAGAVKASVAGCLPVGADAARGEDVEPDLRSVVDAWPTLPELIRAAILAIVKVAPLSS